jgi:hypothetical protein
VSVCNGFGKSFIAIAIVVLATCQGAAASNELTGEMAKLSYLLGTWTCNNYLRSSAGIPSVVTYEVGPRNTIHEHWASQRYGLEGDSYYKYSSTTHEYYETSADSGGSNDFGSSSDGVTYSVTSQGPNGSEKSSFVIRTLSADSLGIRSQTIYNGNRIDGNADCSRQE